MDPYQAWLREVLQLAGEIYFRRVEAELWQFAEALDQWLHELFAHPRPDWRESFDELLALQEAEGRVVEPKSRQELLEFLEGWAKTVHWSTFDGLMSVDDGPIAVVAAAGEAGVGTPVAASKDWPALTPSEAESAQRSTGLPWWYPIQPRNRMDSLWQRQLESVGQTGRDRLLVFFREVAALGRMSRGVQDPEQIDIEPLQAQRQEVQKAYDGYIRAKLDIYREWTRYLSMEWFIGPEVFKVFRKVDNALPDGVHGFKSSHDDALKAARRAGFEATNKKMRRTDAAYTALVWTDNVIAAVEIATLVGSAKAVFTQAAKRLAAKGLSQAAARSVAVAYAVAHLGTAAASAAVIGGVIPKVLVDAGLDEADVRAGLAVFRTLSTLVGLRALAKQPKRPSRPHRRRPKDKGSEDAEPVRWDETHPLIEGVPDAPRTRAHEILQRATAEEMQAEGSYVRVGMGRPLSEFSGLKHSPDIRPDDIGLTSEGRIDMFEIMSPSQTKEELETKLEKAMNQLPPEMRGGFRVIDPRDAFE